MGRFEVAPQSGDIVGGLGLKGREFEAGGGEFLGTGLDGEFGGALGFPQLGFGGALGFPQLGFGALDTLL